MNLLKIEEIRKQGNRIGYTCSTFDLLHAGHIAMLAEAKSKCDFLIAGILSDPTNDRASKQKPCQSLFERWVQLDAVSYVDMIIPFETEAEIIEIIKGIRPDIRIVGEDYKSRDFTGKSWGNAKPNNYYNARQHDFSSSELRKRIENG